MDDQADYLAKQWLLAHYKINKANPSKHPEDILLSAELCTAIEAIFDYMGEPNEVLDELAKQAQELGVE
jgi:hypothetical protein